jgi:toxin FitB
MLLDSNIIIYSSRQEYPEMETFLTSENIFVSAISRVEVLGYHNLPTAQKLELEIFFQTTKTFPVSSEVIDVAVSLRQQRKMSLGDAIIAGTAIAHDKTLVTRNVRDFQWIEELRLYNPIND